MIQAKEIGCDQQLDSPSTQEDAFLDDWVTEAQGESSAKLRKAGHGVLRALEQLDDALGQNRGSRADPYLDGHASVIAGLLIGYYGPEYAEMVGNEVSNEAHWALHFERLVP